MRLLETRLSCPALVEPVVHADRRGFLHEAYRQDLYARIGIPDEFVQDNHSRSSRGVVRGMHFRAGGGEAKLVRCARGSIFDVVLDLRRGSPTFGGWEAFELDDENLRQVYVPIGFAHGFCVTSQVADVVYKSSSYYDSALERAIRYDDPDIEIRWPDGVALVTSERDANAPLLRDVEAELDFPYRG